MRWIVYPILVISCLATAFMPLDKPCNPIVYRHVDSVAHWTDDITVEFIIEENARRGKCAEAIYIAPDTDYAPLNMYHVVITGE